MPDDRAPHSSPGWSRRRLVGGTLGLTLGLTALGLLPVLASVPDHAPEPGDPTAPAAGPAVARGRRVYIAEGCIHCHSQYVRPTTRDQALWGPARPEVLEETPPLLGVRRQGPDLADVGNRRSPTWQRLHLIDPRSLVPGSRMPSYARLFEKGDSRGPDLVAYLGSLGRDTAAARRALVERAEVPGRAGSVARGGALFGRYCTPCHGAGGRGDGPLAEEILRDDPDPDAPKVIDLGKGAFWAVSWSPRDATLEAAIARTVRFGLPGTAMPGHEYLSDGQVVDLVAYVKHLARRRGPHRPASSGYLSTGTSTGSTARSANAR